ncbi:MAG TPA: DMT family transporter [Bryobacteraceae bacterium]|nr:DMT family transporter [Bryobacteraceae bacterium]HPT25030.1 DMT family transporter [Bryobacteraceae bacterium]
MKGVRARAEVTLAGIALIWGGSFVVVKVALNDSSTLAFLATRFVIASLLLLGVFWPALTGGRPNRKGWFGGVVCSIFLFLGFAFQTAGLRYTSASNSAFLTGLYIVLVPLFASALSKRSVRAREWAACGLALLGTGLMTGAGSERLNIGDLLTIASAVAFSAHMVAVAHWSPKLSYEWLTLIQVGGVAVLSLASFWWIEQPFLHWTPRLIGALALTAVLATALSFSLYTWAQGHTTATRAALLFALEPVFAGLVAWAVAGDLWTGLSLLGAGLILGSILLAELRPDQTNKKAGSTNGSSL